MMPRLSRLYGAALLLGAGACTFIVGNKPKQCENDSDCSAFAGTRCATDGLCKVVSIEKDGGGGSGSCSDNQTCVTILGSKAFCDQSSKTCVDLGATVCSSVTGLLSNEDAVRVGALVPSTFGANQTQGQAIEAAIKQAVEGFNGGLAAPARPLAVIMCDETATGAIDILLNKLQVTAIVGEPSTALAMQAKQTNTAVIAPFFPPDATFTLAYSLAPAPDRQAGAMREVLKQQLLPKLSANPTVVLVNTPDAYSKALSQALVGDLTGVAVTAKTLEVVPMATADATAQSIIDLSPHVVVMLGDATFVPVITQIEAVWPNPAALPLYLLSDRLEVPLLYNASGVAALSGTDPALRKRVLGTGPGGLLSAAIAQDYILGMSGKEPRTAGAAFAYDAVYLLAYAATAQHDVTPLTGDVLINAFPRLSGGPSPVSVGPADRDAALKVLVAPGTGAVELTGITGPLDFTNRVAATDIQVWCVSKSGTKVAFSDAGLTYGANNMLTGTLVAACQ
jgi:ABC-type branched-subunit amino acid transport system substrate-binding protein